MFGPWATGLIAWMFVVGHRGRVPYGYAWVFRVMALVLLAIGLTAAALTGWVWSRDAGFWVLALALAVGLGWSLATHEAGETVEPAAVAVLDALAVAGGTVGTITGAVHAGGPHGLAVVRALVGAAFLGGINAAMLFGHRYLAKPQWGREPLHRTVTGLIVLWPLEVAVMLIPTGMVAVFTGAVDDHYGGILGWMWAACAVTTGGLLVMARVILRDPRHRVVASATGLVYLAAITGFGIDLLARAVLSG